MAVYITGSLFNNHWDREKNLPKNNHHQKQTKNPPQNATVFFKPFEESQKKLEGHASSKKKLLLWLDKKVQTL